MPHAARYPGAMIERLVAGKRRIGFARLSVISAAVSSAVAAIGARSLGTEPSGVLLSALLGMTQGFLIPMSVLLVSDAVHGRPSFKRLHYLLQLLIQILLLVLVTIAISMAGNLAVTRSMDSAVRSLPVSLEIGFAIAVVMVFYSTLREFLGRRFLRDLALGLYGGAREEQAIVVFVDIKGSTAIAESLPPIRFFELLNDFFALVDSYVAYYDGTIYKYLGDGAVLAWKSTPENAGRVRDLVTGLRDDLVARADRFRLAYGCTLDCTCGVHAGPVLVGGIGREKRELGYWGDTLNTTSRIQGVCSQVGEPALFSAEYVSGLAAPPAGSVVPELRRIDGVELRGKQGTHTLYAVARAPAEPERSAR
jgi:adenylate cyclase